MAKVYRYSGKRYNDALLALGNLRIGTLHDFRRDEHKKGIADPNEGKKTVRHVIKYASSDDGHSIHSDAIEKFGGLRVGKKASVIWDNVHLSQDFNYLDCFVHCSSYEYSKKAMSQFGGAESCVEIFDLYNFYYRLTQSLSTIHPVRLRALERVVYMERVEQWDGLTWGVHPALIKEPIFSPQVEFRAIWQPIFPDPIAPVVINDVGLIKFCRSVPLPE